MAILTQTYHITRYASRKDFSGYQVLTRITRVLGIPIWVREIDREDVPSWATIQRMCLGYSEWRSRLFEQHGHLLGEVQPPSNEDSTS